MQLELLKCDEHISALALNKVEANKYNRLYLNDCILIFHVSSHIEVSHLFLSELKGTNTFSNLC